MQHMCLKVNFIKRIYEELFRHEVNIYIHKYTYKNSPRYHQHSIVQNSCQVH